jgi:hypothetical protein
MSKPLVETSERSVRAFGPDGARRRNCTPETAERLASLKLVIAQRNPKTGAITVIHFCDHESRIGHGSHVPLQARLKAGTRYSFREQIGDGHGWAHHRLPYVAMDAALGRIEPREVVDQHVRALYRGVELSVMAA